MKWLLDIIKGMLIGISNIIPGFSGGTMAVMLKIYDRVIYDISDITKHPIKSIKDLIFLGIGLVLGMVFAMFTIAYLLEKFPFQTIMFFAGLIIGSIPNVYKSAVNENPSKLNYLFIIPAIAIMVIIPMVSSAEKTLEISFVPLLLVFIVGIISAATMVIPGISGSLTLMALGYYSLILTSGTTLMKKFVSGEGFLDEFILMLVFTIGCALGILLISKIMGILLKKAPHKTYFFILGLILASPFAIIWSATHNSEYNISYSALMWVASIITLIIGIILPILVEMFVKKMREEKEAIALEGSSDTEVLDDNSSSNDIPSDNVEEDTNKDSE